MNMTGAKLAIVLAFLCVLSWSLIPIVAKIGQHSLDVFQFLFWSNVLSFVVVLVFALLKNRKIMIAGSARQFFWCAPLGFLGCFFYYLCLYHGYEVTNGVEVLVVQYTWPILITVISLLFFSERLTMFGGAGLLLGFLSVVIVITKGDLTSIKVNSPWVLLVVFLGALCFALFSVLSKYQKIDSFTGTFFLFFWGVFFSSLTLFQWSHFSLPSEEAWLVIVLNGALINGVSYILWLTALAKADATKVAPIVFLTPILSTTWLVLFFQEPLLLSYIIAIAFSIISGVLVLRSMAPQPVKVNH
ncbi:DMT family transporter [Zooshikella ganghwensis]|uniref:DMT family transporter n=1 Tax=Zooshikella ganghwensis TaxID=202772 RepID=A0A4P9VN37_9GAMM|nr:DMT family transporter [Zooshikella ganghwensis]RDH43814.1 DMT family transporter [Zooshikella ganghwensis]